MEKQNLEDVKLKENPTPEENRIQVHSSGLKYYTIKLLGEGENKIVIRLFESVFAGRLIWADDQETDDELAVRRAYMNKLKKEQKKRKSTLIWDSKTWGTFNQANALRVQSAINEKKDLSKLIKLG